MNLLEIIENYQFIIKTSNETIAKTWLRSIGIADPVIVSIINCFNSDGSPKRTMNKQKEFSFI